MMENEQEALHIEKKVFLKTILDGFSAAEVPPFVAAVILKGVYFKFIAIPESEIRTLLLEIEKDSKEAEAKRNEQVN